MIDEEKYENNIGCLYNIRRTDKMKVIIQGKQYTVNMLFVDDNKHELTFTDINNNKTISNLILTSDFDFTGFQLIGVLNHFEKHGILESYEISCSH